MGVGIEPGVGPCTVSFAARRRPAIAASARPGGELAGMRIRPLAARWKPRDAEESFVPMPAAKPSVTRA
ncbi:MAG: hypothetical protein JWR28_2169, partial [Modestobacter sp.]|nr:hypothetical protein [Modestobacter sp.]